MDETLNCGGNQAPADAIFAEMASGYAYDGNDPALLASLKVCEDLCYDYNAMRPSQEAERVAILRRLLGHAGKKVKIIPRFFCDYGFNISVGENFFANTGLTILDEAQVTFGDNVFVGPNCSFYTADHPLDVAQRNNLVQRALPITVGSNVWICGNVTVVPGVTIGSSTVIGAGSVVVKDIPDGVVAAGNPCRVIRPITEADVLSGPER